MTCSEGEHLVNSAKSAVACCNDEAGLQAAAALLTPAIGCREGPRKHDQTVGAASSTEHLNTAVYHLLIAATARDKHVPKSSWLQGAAVHLDAAAIW